MKIKTFSLLSLLCCLFATQVRAQDLSDDAVCPDWQSEIPRVVFPDRDLVDLYEKTWEIAAGRVRTGPEGMAASPYLDENCYEDQIWIWDGCFMVLFSKYAPKAYPGKETLMNYYVPIHDHVRTPLLIHLRDNPPLFAWVENENYRFTGDREQVNKVLYDKQYLQKHFIYFDTIPQGNVNTDVSPAYNPIHRGVVHDSEGNIIGYTWHGGASGMDNNATGDYWRGGIWLPTAYMGTKALEKYGYYDLADELAERVVRLQLRTYQSVEPHTIWECYSPSADSPSTEHGRRARPDFCGWSALGPISLFIENIMGFRSANALTRTVTWSLKAGNGTHGLRHFHFGDITTDLIYNAETGRIEADSNKPFLLNVNGKKIKVKAGKHSYPLAEKYIK